MVAELSIHKIKRIKEKEERKRIKKKNKVLSAERLGTKLRVTENRCVLFNSLSHAYIYLRLRRMRWKAYFFLNPDTITHSKDTYGFKSTKNPPPIDESKGFEDDMLKMIQSTKF